MSGLDPTKPVDVQTLQPFDEKLQRQGYVIVITGDGKGKTTSGLGLMLRALGRKLNVLLIKFTKGGNHYGSLYAVQQFKPAMAKRLTVVQAGLDRIVFKSNQNDDDAIKIKQGWALAKQAAQSGHYDLIIMDEANIAVDMGFIPLDEMLDFINHKPESLDILLTGRRAHPDVIEAAHLVSDVQPVKHYWDIGVKARPGIEF